MNLLRSALRLLKLCPLSLCLLSRGLSAAAPPQAQAPQPQGQQAAGTPTTAARRPMQFDDLMKMRRLGDLDVSPDSRWVLFSVTDVDLARNSRTPHLWIVPLPPASEAEGLQPAGRMKEKPLTASQAGESRGRFSPDGRQIAFISARDGKPQIYLAPFDPDAVSLGEPRRITSLSTGAEGVTWSPDGQSLLFTSSVYPDCNDDGCNRDRDAAEQASQVKAQLFTHLLYRHWNAFTGKKRSHLFLVPAAGGPRDPTPRDLTPGVDHDIPPFSLGNPDGYAFSPDGKEIAFEWNTDPEPALSTNADIFTLSLADPASRPVRISTSPGGDFTPRYSPDGRYIAWRSQARAGYESDRFRLVLYDRHSKQIRELLPSFDRWVDDLAWAPDSKTIYFVSGHWGEAPVFAARITGGQPLALTQVTYEAPNNLQGQPDYGEYADPHVAADGKSLVLSRMTVRSPAEIASLDLTNRSPADSVPSDSKKEARQNAAEVAHYRLSHASVLDVVDDEATQHQLTHLNTALLNQLDLPPMQSFWFTGAGNTRVQGFLIRPPGFDPHQHYPLKFLIHGGPEGAWGDSWSYRWNPELMAASGYVVVMVNPRGSTGYGQAFTDGVNGDWGGKPYLDLMRGLDYAERAFPYIDRARECALGASYGGYMADWILGHTTRFACIVTHDGLFNTESAYGATEELWFNEWEFRGTPWGATGKTPNRALYRRWSPHLFATSFKTPTLVIHSQLDYRLDVSQGFDLFTTLQRLGVPSEMLYFPDEGHWVLKPQNSQLWNQTVSDWCDRWTHTQPHTPPHTPSQSTPPPSR